MDYGFWLIAAHRIGHTPDFRGPFDIVMAFFFYLPNLALAELLLRSPALPGDHLGGVEECLEAAFQRVEVQAARR
jgi:hypothetical protein